MRTSKKIINLYNDKNTSSIKHVISINTEEDLNQFWDYMSTAQESSDHYLSSFISYFYNFALSYINQDKAQFFEIILEENENNLYFTLWNENISLLFQKYLSKTSIEYLHKQNKISIKLLKKIDKIDFKKIKKENQKRENKLINSVLKSKKTTKTKPYTFIQEEDLEDLMHLNEDLQDIIYKIQKNGINENKFIKLRSTISLFCFTLRFYNQVETITFSINELLNLMNVNKDKFISLDNLELTLVCGFINNIDRWFNTLFILGGADLHFMDNSMQADYVSISQIVEPTIISCESNLDAIFDF